VLSVRDLRVSYSGVVALHGVDLELGSDELVAVIGPNGAGKTTLLKTLAGTLSPDGGSAELDGVDLFALPGYRRARLGLTHVPEGRHIFGSMTVEENLILGAYRQGAKERFRERMDLVSELFPVLKSRMRDDGASLSGGQQQMLAIARGLVACPRILLLDEPSMGLSPVAGDQIFEAIARLRELESTAVILVEQRIQEVLELCQRVYVMESGAVLLEGTPKALAADDRIARAYLGGEL
jgi:branched-chain amino acid transport system ATP-binding protein